MANDTRSSCKIKDDENSISKGRLTNGKGVTSSSTESPDTSGLRRSSRETSLSKKNLTPEASSSSSKKNMTSETASSEKNMTTPSPSSTRKSDRLNKQTSKTLPVQNKSERVEKQTVLTMLRRSERGKKPTSPCSSGSKKSDKSLVSSEIRKKEKKEKRVKQLTMEIKEVSDRSQKQDAKHVRVGKRLMDARAYKALFKKFKAADHNKELERIDKSSEGYSCNFEDDSSKQVSGVVEGNERRLGDLRETDVASSVEIILEGSNADVKESVKGTSEAGDCMEVSKIDVMAREISNDSELARVDCFVKENLDSPELLDYMVDGGIRDTDIGLKEGEKFTPLQRKRNKVDMVTDDSAVVASKDTHVLHADVVPLSPTGCAEIWATGFKRQRVDSDSIKQKICSYLPNSKEKLNGDLCDTSVAKDSGELQANVTPELAANCKNSMQQNGFYEEDIPACGDQNICLICKLGGKLLCCYGKGCKSSYHLSCLDPPLEDVPLGGWHCAMCVEKKIESGVHSLSEGVESIWDAREVELSNDDELRRQKQYFVKYKGLAHVHNCWVSESELLSEVPLLVAKFNRKNEVIRWKQEWTLPHHLVRRRSLISPKRCNEYFIEHAGKDSDCHYEWLVKWRGLGYEYATWELGNESFIKSPQGQRLIRDYENRCNRAKQTSLSSVEKAQRQKTNYPVKLSQLPAGGSSGLDNSLDVVNKLRECWLKGLNAVIFDDEERIAKVILFILSLLSDISRPFLIISTSNILHLWEDCFSRIAPSADVVVYNGSIEIRKHIRTLEFYEEGGCIMFQALITSPEVVIEDLNEFESIGWEAMIIDEGQCSKISSHFEQFKLLSTDTRLLLVSGQLKDSVTEYCNVLSLLESCGGLDRSDGLVLDTNENIGSLRQKLLKYVAYGGKPDSSRFMEYWIPVHISDVQLEQYCAILLSKSLLLSSPLKNDPVGALRDIVFSIQKCCDHPYLVDQSLQSLLIKDLNETEYLDVGIKASGKLQLLDTMLLEMKNKGLRVLILFQSIGGGRDSISIGDILDDFVRQRFGPDSYERVDGYVVPSKKQAALNNFNKETGRFVFLLETRACLPSVKLSSVDTVIIFHSDWSPVNDLRALQKITLDSKFELIKVFRLYSSCTVEEKVLVLAKQDKTPDGYMQNMRPVNRQLLPVNRQLLLMWGASYLFNRLDEFHGGNIPASRSSNFFEKSLLKHVGQEFLTILAQTGEDNFTRKLNVILKVKQNKGTYSTSFPLFGESKNESMEKGTPYIFWTKLLDGKNPCWKYSSVSAQRSRKRVQCFDDLLKKPEAENDIVKKHRKVANCKVNLSSVKPGLEEGKIVSCEKQGTSVHSNTLHLNCGYASPLVKNIPESSRELRYSQKSLHLLLMPEIANLCEVLQLREDVKDVAEKFLEYVMINHRVDREPVTILQAFEISLCWTAASLLKQKIDHKESLALAKQYLSFGCKKEEADYIYSMLQCLKKVFLYKMEKLNVVYCPKASELCTTNFNKEQSKARLSESETSDMPKVKVEVDWSTGQECSEKLDLFKVAQKDISRSIRGIKKKCHKQKAKLLQKQQEETESIDKRYEEDKAQLENMKKTEAAVIRLYSHGKMQIDKLKILDNDYAKQLEALKHERDMRLEKLEAMHVAAMNKVCEREDSWVKAVKSWLEVELSYKPPCNEVGHGVQCLQTVEQENAHDNQENGIPDSSHISESQNPYKLVNTVPVGENGVVESSGLHETMPDEAVAHSFPVNTVTLQVRPDTESDELDTIASEKTSIAGFMENREPSNSDNDQENVIYLNPCSREQILDGAILSMPTGQIQLEVTETIIASDGSEDGLPSVHSSGGQIHDQTRLSCLVEVPGAVANTVSSNDGVENAVPLNSPSFGEQIPDGATSSMPDGEILVEVPETARSSNGTEAMDFSLSEKLIATGDILAMADGDVSSCDGPENVVPLDPSSVEQIPGGARSGMHGAKVLSLVPESPPGEIVESGNINRENNEGYAMTSDNAAAVEHDSVGYSVDLPSVQIWTSVAEDSPLPSNQALQDTYYDPAISTGVQDGNVTASEMQITSQVEPPLSLPVDAVASNQSYHTALATEPVVNGVGPEPSSENCSTSQFALSLNQAPSQPVASSLYPLIDNYTDGLGAIASDARTAAVTSGYSNHSVQNAGPVASRLTHHEPQDPLQNELDKLHKSIDEAIKIHDETKHKLKSDCDQEIEEVVAQIRRKYEIRLQKVEAEFLIRKKELDANENKVLMNKILAEAFRSKCMDLGASSAGLQQGVSTHIQHLVQLLSQRSAQRPSILAGPSSGPSSSVLQSSATPATSLQSTSPAVRLHAAAPPSQAVHSSWAHISSIPTRPPHISSIGSPTPNHQIGSGIRAPAPHLQPLRPSISLSSTSLPSSVVLPSPLIPSNPCPSSLSLAQRPHLPPLPTYNSGTYNRAQRQ